MLRRDPLPLVVLVVMPVIMASLYQTTFRAALLLGGRPDASGADFAVPAGIAQFGFFLVPFTGFVFLREHMWKTWTRVRASAASPAEIVVGKAVPMLALGVLQAAVLLAHGVIVLDLHLRDDLVPFTVVVVAYVCCAVTIGVALTALVRTSQQLNAGGFLGAMLLGAIGGALVPIDTLPQWTRHLAPATPQYWVMRATGDLILDGEGAGVVLLPLVVLAAFTLACAFVAITRMSFDERNVGWA